jgi:trehalose 6-phosphate synthase
MAETALITPLKDGMNLIAKEFCAASLEEDCVLVLSEFAGAAAQLQRGALLVNPHDTERVADAVRWSIQMSTAEKRQRMKRLRDAIKRQDIYWWVDSFLSAGIARKLDTFPIIEDYLPQFDIEGGEGRQRP